MTQRNYHLSAGDIVADRYTVHEQLGRGGAAVVYRVFDAQEEKMRALKTPLPFLMHREGPRQRFFREMRLAARLVSDHTATLRDVGITPGGLPWFTMDLLEGEDLEQALKQCGAMSPVRAMHIALQILGSLGEAHRAGIIHRDLKPSNVFLCARDRVKVTDFGLSIAAGEGSFVTCHGEAVGTLPYMAPEYLLDNVLSPSMDQYAVGLILYESILGHSPYAGLGLSDIHWQKRFDISMTRDDLCSLGHAGPVVLRATTSDPAARYLDVDAMGEALVEALDAMGGVSLPPPRPEEMVVRRTVRAAGVASDELLAAYPVEVTRRG